MQSFKIVAVLLVAFAASAAAGTGSLSVYNSGSYVATFDVEYYLNRERKSESSGKFSLGVTKEISIPEGATNVYLKVQEYWFIGSLTTIFTKSFDGPVHKCYKIWGTTLNPSHAEQNC
ncbi:hypothetical protein V9T40_003307 [Parthenolecanium corni]|uniref:Uncharacterized protein n=1 Tax=Parthenolecanium corni TaxID=536013 RepID=A0AAN9U2H4_9HEMI